MNYFISFDRYFWSNTMEWYQHQSEIKHNARHQCFTIIIHVYSFWRCRVKIVQICDWKKYMPHIHKIILFSTEYFKKIIPIDVGTMDQQQNMNLQWIVGFFFCIFSRVLRGTHFKRTAGWERRPKKNWNKTCWRYFFFVLSVYHCWILNWHWIIHQQCIYNIDIFTSYSN